MEICGNIYVTKGIKSFSMKCTYCEKSVEEWLDFVSHINSDHNSDEEDWLEDMATDGIKVDILIDGIKPDEFLDECMMDHDNNDYANSLINSEEEFLKEENVCELVQNKPLRELSKSPIAASESNDSDLNDIEFADNDPEYDPENGSATETNEQEFQKPSQKFNPSFYRRKTSTTEFIDLYKSYPCLWNPNDVNYRNFPMRTEAHEKIIDAMQKKFNIIINERILKAAVKKLRRQYYSTLQLKQKKHKSKIPVLVLEHFEKCSFLSVFDDTPEDITNESDSMKGLIFNKINDVTLAFIDAYGRFPALYDPNHCDYTNVPKRKQAYENISNDLKTLHNTVFTEDELYKGIYNLRQWYYKARERHKKGEILNDAQQVYVDRSSFLPPKTIKKRLACEVCGKISHNDITLQVHMYKEHQIGEWPYKCPDCERSFEHRSSLLMHKQRSHVGKQHKCEYCDRRFAVLVDMQRHVTTHTGERPFVCELCGKSFRNKTQLGYHSAAIHTKLRAFKCTMCPKDFLKRGDLKDHIKAHLNIRDKICETCGKGFTNCHSLIRHRQIHSEVKKFVCKLCDAKFHQFVGLNAHMKRTHNIVKNKPAT